MAHYPFSLGVFIVVWLLVPLSAHDPKLLRLARLLSLVFLWAELATVVLA